MRLMRTPTPRPLRGLLAFAALLGVAGLGLSGFAALRRTPPSPVPFAGTSGVHVIGGLDDSEGFQTHLGQGASLLASLNGRLDSDTDLLTLRRVNFVTTEFFNDPPPDSAEELRALLTHTFRNRPTRDGTRPSLFFGVAARDAAQETKPTVLLYVSDGDQDFPAAQEETALRAAGKSLADSPRIKAVILCGVSPENWTAWQHRFGALNASGRLHLMPLDRAALDKVSTCLDAARSTAGVGATVP